jgi:hypothetical protein
VEPLSPDRGPERLGPPDRLVQEARFTDAPADRAPADGANRRDEVFLADEAYLADGVEGANREAPRVERRQLQRRRIDRMGTDI